MFNYPEQLILYLGDDYSMGGPAMAATDTSPRRKRWRRELNILEAGPRMQAAAQRRGDSPTRRISRKLGMPKTHAVHFKNSRKTQYVRREATRERYRLGG